MTDWSKCPVVESVPGRVSGAWVFKDTRLPVSALFENLESGATVSDFLEWFEGVEEREVREVLQFVADSLKPCACRQPAVRILFDQGTPRPLRGDSYSDEGRGVSGVTSLAVSGLGGGVGGGVNAEVERFFAALG